MRRSRKRRRDGQRCVTVVVLDREIAALVTRGLLDPDARNDRHAIGAALGKLMDRMPPEHWPVAPQR
jgi:hypothetical protein